MRRLNFSLLAFLLSVSVVKAADPALLLQGSGTEDDPWLITSQADLLTLADACNAVVTDYAGHYAGKYFKMTADIDMSRVRDFYGIATAPASVASSNKYQFQGIFDGQGHKILSLDIDGVKYDSDGKAIGNFGADQSRKWVGLFGVLGDGAEVRNVIMADDCYISGVNCVGAIAGSVSGGALVENCSNHGTVVSLVQSVGGIAGDVSTTATGKPAVVRNCFNSGSVSVNDKYAGGIVGYASFATIENCANIGEIAGYSFNALKAAGTQTAVGGIAGYANATKINSCINFGDVMADNKQAGGIAGYFALNSSKGNVSDCINTGCVRAVAQYNLAGNIVGDTGTSAATNGSAAVTTCYYDAQLLGSNMLAGIGVGEDIQGLTTAQLTNGSKLSSLGDGWTYSAGHYPVPAAITDPSVMVAAAQYITLLEGQTTGRLVGNATISTVAPGSEGYFSSDYPGFSVNGSTVTAVPGNEVVNAVLTLENDMMFRSVYITTYAIPFGGSGTQSDPYTLADKNDIVALADITNKARCHWAGNYFIMTGDIDMSGTESFKGIGAGVNTLMATNAPNEYFFSGVFDGNGFALRNLYIDGIARDENNAVLAPLYGSLHNCGLFGSLGEGAVIQNLTLDSSCKIIGYSSVGGLAGALAGNATIDNCHVAAGITAYNRYCGGVFGYSAKYAVKISRCTFSGLIHSNYDYVGGIAGWDGHADAVIDNCVNLGRIVIERFDASLKESTAVQRIGGIAAINSGTITNCASYGPITVDVPEVVTDINGVGGLVGQNTNGAKNGSIKGNLTTGQVYVKGGAKHTAIGSAIGYEYYGAANAQGDLCDNYVDNVLNVQTETIGLLNADFGADAVVAATTSQLTSGTAIEALASGFTFETGYYPMPKAIALRDDVRAAAATFMLVPDGQTINNILSGVTVHFNNVMPLTASLEDGSLFFIRDNALRSEKDGQTGDDLLTLTNGTFSNFYPLHKDAQSGIVNVTDDDVIDNVVEVRHYTVDGRLLAAPQPGQPVITISVTDSGRQIVTRNVN